MSRGSTSSRTNWSAQSNFSWNSGSVSKSHAMVVSPCCRSGQNSILKMENTMSPKGFHGDGPTGVAGRIAERSLAPRGAEYAAEIRRLLDAALTVIGRYGTDKRPRVADIVVEAGLSNDAFYRHFPSKDALVSAILED